MSKYGVTCNAIRPNAGTRLTLTDDMRQAAARKLGPNSGGTVELMHEQLAVEDVAPLVVWLASDASANVSGCDFHIQTGSVAIYTKPVMENKLTKDGGFTIDELFELMPTRVAAGVSNLTPPEAPKK